MLEKLQNFLDSSTNLVNTIKSKKANNELANANKKMQDYLKDINIIPELCLLIGGMCLLGSFSTLQEEGFGGFILLFLSGLVITAGGVWAILHNNSPKHKSKRLPNYISCIAESDGSLDKIASHLGYDYETVVSDISFLIDKNILVNSHINHSERKLISPIVGEMVSKKLQ